MGAATCLCALEAYGEHVGSADMTGLIDYYRGLSFEILDQSYTLQEYINSDISVTMSTTIGELKRACNGNDILEHQEISLSVQ